MVHQMVRTSDDVVVARGLITIVTVTPEGSARAIPTLLREHLDSWASGVPLAEPVPPTPGQGPG